MSGAYYNDFDADVCAVLRELIKRGLIPDGEVDGRSILDVDPADLAGFVQCHFFAGIGGWGYALRLAGWPDDKPVWTGSPPCQPFSVAGKGLAADDPRHLGPAFVRLVWSARPGVLFGEQVASADVFGHVAGGRKRGVAGQPQWTWIDDLFLRLEAARYAAWAVDYPSASIGAPHIRQRTYFGAVGLADAVCEGQLSGAQRGIHRSEEGAGARDAEPQRSGSTRFPEPAAGPTYGPWGDAAQPGRGRHADGAGGASGRLADADDARSQGRGEPGRERAVELTVGSGGLVGRLADADGRNPCAERQQRGGEHRFEQADGGAHPEPATGPTYGPWGDADWLYSRDGRWRPVEARAQPLADGLPEGMGRVRNPRAQETEKAIEFYVKTTQTGPAEVLRDLCEALAEEAARERQVGGMEGLLSPSLLLAFVCQLAAQGWPLAQNLPLSRPQEPSRGMRMLWDNEASASSSRQRGLVGQQTGEPANIVHILSPFLARDAQSAWGEAIAADAEVGFPLGHRSPARTSRLRGYGNAINPHQAAHFIRTTYHG